MKRVFLILLALALAAGLLWQISLPLDAKAAQWDLENLRYDDHVDMTGKTVEILDVGFVKRSKTYGRTFEPTLTREEYYAVSELCFSVRWLRLEHFICPQKEG